MEHSSIVPLVILKKKRFSIIQIATQVVSFYKKLSASDSSYRYVNIISEKKGLYQSINITDSNAVSLLAKEILHQNLDDIQRINRIDSPDVNFSRDEMINFALEVKTENQTLITLNYSFSVKLPRISSIVVNKKCFDSFIKAKFFLDVVKESFLIDYAIMKISDSILNEISRRYKAPIGWISYFSKNGETKLPYDLSNIEYEYTTEGVYLISSRENIVVDSTKMESTKQQLIEIMRQIEEKQPAYVKK